MGGFYGSGRWRWQATRLDTDSALALDVRLLARQGGLAPGAHALQWTRSTVPMGAITVRVEPGNSDAVVLAYSVEVADEAPRTVHERVALARTPCRYGGTRPWFVCPGCNRRRAVLYGVGGAFRCRACHDLAYTSTRETRSKRMLRRAEAVRAKLGGHYGGGVFDPPARPRGMHRRTYARLCADLLSCQLDALEAFLGGR